MFAVNTAPAVKNVLKFIKYLNRLELAHIRIFNRHAVNRYTKNWFMYFKYLNEM